MKRYFDDLSVSKIYLTILTLIILTPYVKSFTYGHTQTFKTVFHESSQPVVLRSKSIYKKEIYEISIAGPWHGKALFLIWKSFSLPNGKMPSCSGAYLKVSTGCRSYEKEVGRFCGKLTPHDIYTFTGCIKIEWFTTAAIRNFDNFRVTTGIIKRSSIPTTQCDGKTQFTHSGVIFTNNWVESTWQTDYRYCSFTIQTLPPYYVIKINRIESDYQMDSDEFFRKVKITGQGTNQVKISFRMWTSSPSHEYFMIGWVSYSAPPSPSTSPTKSAISQDSLSKGEKAALIVGLVVFFLGIVPVIVNLICKRWRESHQTITLNNNITTSPSQNANLNQAFNNDGDTSQSTEVRGQILRDAVLSSGIPPPPKYSDVFADEALPPPPKYEDVCS